MIPHQELFDSNQTVLRVSDSSSGVVDSNQTVLRVSDSSSVGCITVPILVSVLAV